MYHALAGKTLDYSRKMTDRARATGSSGGVGPAAKRAKMAHLASIERGAAEGAGGGGGPAMSEVGFQGLGFRA